MLREVSIQGGYVDEDKAAEHEGGNGGEEPAASDEAEAGKQDPIAEVVRVASQAEKA